MPEEQREEFLSDTDRSWGRRSLRNDIPHSHRAPGHADEDEPSSPFVWLLCFAALNLLVAVLTFIALIIVH